MSTLRPRPTVASRTNLVKPNLNYSITFTPVYVVLTVIISCGILGCALYYMKPDYVCEFYDYRNFFGKDREFEKRLRRIEQAPGSNTKAQAKFVFDKKKAAVEARMRRGQRPKVRRRGMRKRLPPK